VYTLFENIARAEYVLPSSLQRDHPQLALLITGMLEPDKNKRVAISEIINHQYSPSSFWGFPIFNWICRWLQSSVQDGEEPLEIVASRTLFTPEFISELSKIKNEEGKSGNGRGTKRNCFCILV